jgi:hypothetical protein
MGWLEKWGGEPIFTDYPRFRDWSSEAGSGALLGSDRKECGILLLDFTAAA